MKHVKQMNIQYILFYGPKGQYAWASNFYISDPFFIDNETWNNTEQYFQTMKFRYKSASSRCIEYSNLIKNTDSPAKSKALGSQRKNGNNWVLNKTDHRLINNLIDEYKDVKINPHWDKKRFHIMIKALLAKFKNPTLCDKLSSIPDNAILVEHTERDTVWGDGGDGGSGEKGKNYLGKMLTVISHILKYGRSKHLNKEIIDKLRIGIKKKEIKILSWNINGIRSNVISTQKYTKSSVFNEIDPNSNLGVLVAEHDPDIICMQETRCDETISNCIKIPGYHQYWSCSQGIGARSGARYSGVTMWTKQKPKQVHYTIPDLDEKEGRIILADFGSFLLLNTYVPNAGTNFDYRINTWDPTILKFLKDNQKKGTNIIWCGDLNVARNPIDVFWGDPKSSSYDKAALQGVGTNAKAGYTKEEREDMEKFLQAGYVDVYRTLHPNEEGAYTWWNPRIPMFRSLNRGWRIDYFITSKNIFHCVKDMKILRDAGILTKPQGSDHAAMLLTFKN